MPFVTKNNYSYTKPNETLTIVQKETVVNEYKIDVLNASLDSVCVKDLTITNKLIVPDITLFYRPNPHIFYENHLVFSNTANIVSFKTAEGHSFLNFDKDTNSVFIENFDASSIACKTVHTENLYVDRIITSKGNEIGGVYLKNSTISVPQDANIGGHIVAKDGNIGGCILRNKKGIFSELDVDSIHVKTSLSFTFPETIGGVTLKHGSVSTTSECILSGVILKDSLIDCEKININNNTFIVEENKFKSPVGINTPQNSSNSIGILEVSPNKVKIASDLHVDSKILADIGEIKNVFSENLWIENVAKLGGAVFENNSMTISSAKIDSISNKSIDSETVQCKQLSVKDSFTVSNLNVEDTLSIGSDIKFSKDTVTAKDYTFLDGTSMKNDLLTRNMIVMFKGKKPPRGWVKCDGMFGTPLLLTYNEDVIYIMRT